MFFVIVFNCFSPQFQYFSKHPAYHIQNLSKMISKFSILSQNFKVNPRKIALNKISIGISTFSNLASWKKRHTHARTYVICNYYYKIPFATRSQKRSQTVNYWLKMHSWTATKVFPFFREIFLRNWILFYLHI